jgi:two-component system chemotaxis response regulator CheY
MIMDDSASIRQVVSIALNDAGFEVIESVDGTEALTRLDGRRSI